MLSANSSKSEEMIEKRNYHEPYDDVTFQHYLLNIIDFISDDKATRPRIPDNCLDPIKFFKLSFQRKVD